MATVLLGPLPSDTVHICVDMQRMFAEGTSWHAPWVPRVLPVVERLVAHRPADTLFTRFIPAEAPGDGHGTWKAYWEHWEDMTVSRLAPGMVDLVPSLDAYAPPALVVDKTTYSPWLGLQLEQTLQALGATTLVVSGGETDVCVLATILGAVDRGFRTVVATDALCSSSDPTHGAILTLLNERYGHQVETATTDVVIAAWSAPSSLDRHGRRQRVQRPDWQLA